MSCSKMLCVSHGSVSQCGRRREMEDAVTVEPSFVVLPSSASENENQNRTERLNFYGVYDGHGGSRVAQLCSDRMHQVLADEIHDTILSAGGEGGDQVVVAGGEGGDQEAVAVTVAAGGEGGSVGGGDRMAVVEQNWERIMQSSFMKMDNEIIEGGENEEEEIEFGSMNTVGSTALVAVLSKDKLVVANCGDCRAVLSRGGMAIPLSDDHKPNRPDELERVEAAGGRVINWNGYRVLGVLATSRSIGDQYLKPYVISEPEVIVMERAPNDEFLILASDGLWDVMSNEFACDTVRKCLDGRIVRRSSTNIKRNNSDEAAAMLAELAMARGSRDNISIIIVELNQTNRNIITKTFFAALKRPQFTHKSTKAAHPIKEFHVRRFSSCVG